MEQIVSSNSASHQADVEAIYDQIREDFGVVAEPFALHAPDRDLLAGAWAACRESVIAGRAPRHHMEAVAAAVSEANECPYCVDAHQMMLRASGGDSPAPDGEDADLAPLREWARASVSADTAARQRPPFASHLAPEYIGTAVCFHYVNRMVTVMLDPSPFPGPRALHGLFSRLGARRLASTVQRPKRPGASLPFLADTTPRSGLEWAAESPTVTAAFSGFQTAADAAGERSLDAEVRERVQERIHSWNGEAVGLGRGWLGDELTGLDGRQGDEARLALLTALAPHQVAEDVISAYRDWHPDERDLIGAMAWSASTASTRIGSWLHTSC